MNIKNKLVKIATEKIAEKVVKSDTADNAKNNILTKFRNAMGITATKDYIKGKEDRVLIIKAQSVSEINKRNSHAPLVRAEDSLGITKYQAFVLPELIHQSLISVVNADEREIGRVTEYVISWGVPLAEKEARRVSISIGKIKVAEIKKYVSFGELTFETREGSVRITPIEGERKNRQFNIFYKEKMIATLYENQFINIIKEGYIDRFVLECHDLTNEPIAVLLAIAINACL